MREVREIEREKKYKILSGMFKWEFRVEFQAMSSNSPDNL